MLVTPGPGTYLLPSDFGYLIDPKNSPRGFTQGSLRPRVVSRLQFSTLTGPPISGISNFESTDREPSKFVNRSMMVRTQP